MCSTLAKFAAVIFGVSQFASVAALAQQESPAAPVASEPAKRDAAADAKARLAELEKAKADLEKEIAALKEMIAKAEAPSSGEPKDPYEEAKAEHNGATLAKIGTPVDVGDLRVTLEKCSYERQWLAVKKRFDIDDNGFQDLPIPAFGIVLKIENLSEGKIAQPFDEGNMFGGRAAVIVTDSWGNQIRAQQLESTEYEVRASTKSGLALEGERILPKETKKFYLPLCEPEVGNFKYLTLRVDLKRAERSGNNGEARFYVGQSEIPGLDAAVKRANERKKE